MLKFIVETPVHSQFPNHHLKIMQLTVPITETTTITVALPSFRQYALREVCRHSRTIILTMSFVFASFIVFASSPNVGRGLESTSSSTLNLVVEMSMDRSKAEEKFLAPVAEDIEKVRHFRNLRQRPTGLSTTRQQQHVTVTWNATKEIARLDNDNTPW